MFPYKSLLVVMTVLALTWLIHGSEARPNRAHDVRSLESVKRDIIGLASDIIREAAVGFNTVSKRNGGTGDALYNLPDLSEIGKR